MSKVWVPTQVTRDRKIVCPEVWTVHLLTSFRPSFSQTELLETWEKQRSRIIPCGSPSEFFALGVVTFKTNFADTATAVSPPVDNIFARCNSSTWRSLTYVDNTTRPSPQGPRLRPPWTLCIFGSRVWHSRFNYFFFMRQINFIFSRKFMAPLTIWNGFSILFIRARALLIVVIIFVLVITLQTFF